MLSSEVRIVNSFREQREPGHAKDDHHEDFALAV
jgi:hypothetical protein